MSEPPMKRKDPHESIIDLTTSPMKKRSQKSQLNLDEFIDLTESPMKIPVYSDTELGSYSQSEDERGSFVSEIAEPLDVLTDALKEAEETDAETEETQSNELDLDREHAEELVSQYL